MRLEKEAVKPSFLPLWRLLLSDNQVEVDRHASVIISEALAAAEGLYGVSREHSSSTVAAEG
jgi:hypothetical protein